MIPHKTKATDKTIRTCQLNHAGGSLWCSGLRQKAKLEPRAKLMETTRSPDENGKAPRIAPKYSTHVHQCRQVAHLLTGGTTWNNLCHAPFALWAPTVCQRTWESCMWYVAGRTCEAGHHWSGSFACHIVYSFKLSERLGHEATCLLYGWCHVVPWFRQVPTATCLMPVRQHLRFFKTFHRSARDTQCCSTLSCLWFLHHSVATIRPAPCGPRSSQGQLGQLGAISTQLLVTSSKDTSY